METTNELIDVYQYPLKVLLSDEARALYETISYPQEISLDTLCETIAQIVKKTMDYDFTRGFHVHSTEAQIRYRETMRAQSPTLTGNCAQGEELAKLIFQSLNMDYAEAFIIQTRIAKERHKKPFYNKDIFHAIMGIESEKGYRIINPFSGSIPFGLVKTPEQLEMLGEFHWSPHPDLDEIQQNIVYAGDSDGQVHIFPLSPLVDVFESPEGMIYAGQLVMHYPNTSVSNMHNFSLSRILKDIPIKPRSRRIELHKMDLRDFEAHKWEYLEQLAQVAR
jgi:hypothetical protein